MKTFPIIPLTLLVIFAIGCSPNIDETEKTISLFNGKNLDGWEIQNNGQFSVSDGVLKINQGTGWLRSSDTFGDFLLTMNFAFSKKELTAAYLSEPAQQVKMTIMVGPIMVTKCSA